MINIYSINSNSSNITSNLNPRELPLQQSCLSELSYLLSHGFILERALVSQIRVSLFLPYLNY